MLYKFKVYFLDFLGLEKEGPVLPRMTYRT